MDTAHELTIGNSRVMVRLEDEAERINPNHGLAGRSSKHCCGLPGATPKARAASRRRSATGSALRCRARPPDAVLADYRAAGLDYGPPGAPLETLDELGRVLGMTPAVLAAIRPHLTLFGPPEPNPASTDPVVAAALAAIGQAPQAPTAANQSQPQMLTARITASAFGPSNARLTRVAIVRIWALLPHGYTVLSWASDFD